MGLSSKIKDRTGTHLGLLSTKILQIYIQLLPYPLILMTLIKITSLKLMTFFETKNLNFNIVFNLPMLSILLLG